MTNRSKPAVFILSLLILTGTLAPQPADGAHAKLDTPNKVVDELYRLVTWPGGTLPDWDALKGLFLEESVIILKSREGFNVTDREGFIDLWLKDVESYKLNETGFKEEQVALHLEQSGDMAYAVAVYAASIPGRDRPPQLGIDGYHLIKQGDRWWITSVINEVLRPGVEIPEKLREKTQAFIEKIRESLKR